MATISYAIVLSENLKKAPLYVEQIEVLIDITGAEADSLTLQQIRDDPSIRACFQDRRTNINQLIRDYSAGIRKAPTPAVAEQLLKTFNQKLKSEVSALEKQVQQRVDAFAQQQKKAVNDLFWARAKLVTRVGWSLAKLIKSGAEAVGKTATAVASGGAFFGVIALKAILTMFNDAWSTIQEFLGAWTEERALFKKLQSASNNLRRYKSPQAVPQSAIEDIEKLLGPYGAKLLGADEAAKKLAMKLDKLLAELDKGEFRKAEAQKAVEDQVDLIIRKIRKVSKNVAEGRRLIQSARSKVADAAKRAKADPKRWWERAGEIWKLFDAGMDMAEEGLGAENWAETFRKCRDVLKGKVEDELKDVIAEKVTTL